MIDRVNRRKRNPAPMLKEKFGEDYFQKLGAKGGAAEHKTPRGWAADNDRAITSGSKGGSLSKRNHKFLSQTPTHNVYYHKITGETVTYPRTDI